MNSSPKSFLSDKNSDHPLPTLCWVAAVVGMRFACGQTQGPAITASPNCILAWIKAWLQRCCLPISSLLMVSVLAAGAAKPLEFEIKLNLKVFLGFTTNDSVLGSRSSSQWNSLALAELSSLCQCLLLSHGLWNFIFKSYTSTKSECRYTKKQWNYELSNPNKCIELNRYGILKRYF